MVTKVAILMRFWDVQCEFKPPYSMFLDLRSSKIDFDLIDFIKFVHVNSNMHT